MIKIINEEGARLLTDATTQMRVELFPDGEVLLSEQGLEWDRIDRRNESRAERYSITMLLQHLHGKVSLDRKYMLNRFAVKILSGTVEKRDGAYQLVNAKLIVGDRVKKGQ